LATTTDTHGNAPLGILSERGRMIEAVEFPGLPMKEAAN
jgi:hypothetical protein